MRFVTIEFGDFYAAQVPVHPDVLTLMHAHEWTLARSFGWLDRKSSTCQGLVAGLYADLLLNVSSSVVRLSVGSFWCNGAPAVDEHLSLTPRQLPATLAKMEKLTFLHVDGSLTVSSAVELSDLRELSSVELAELPQLDVLQRLCLLSALTALDLGRVVKDDA